MNARPALPRWPADVPAIGYIAERRCRLLHLALVAARPRTVEEARELPAVALWTNDAFWGAWDQLVAEGSIASGAHGQVIVRARPPHGAA